jgi:phospho-N-acetylmuramoyl-pentapeptide-transferase
MLFYLFDQLSAHWPIGFWSVQAARFDKITFRTALAALASFLLSLVLGPRVIGWLKARFREPVSDRSPHLHRLHQHKAWTPTMGGLFLVACIAIASLLLCRWQNSYVPIVLFNLLALAIVGAVDDLRKLSGHAGGLNSRVKLAAQFTVAAASAIWLYTVNSTTPGGLDLQIPLIGTSLPLGICFVPLTMLVIVGSSNAVNLTDGLDGLAGGCLLTATLAVAILAYIAGHVELANYLGVTHMPLAGETVVIAGAMIGGTLGFLWFNCQPAQVFMGDTGSLSLGGTLGLLAVIARQELLLVLIGGVFVVEALSVMLQVGFYRWCKRRIFLCAPVHHHFQFLGWAENKIVTRFWIVSMLCALLGLGAVKMNRSGELSDQAERQSGASAAVAPAGAAIHLAEKPATSDRG